jgi:hypothetical protein
MRFLLIQEFFTRARLDLGAIEQFVRLIFEDNFKASVFSEDVKLFGSFGSLHLVEAVFL